MNQRLIITVQDQTKCTRSIYQTNYAMYKSMIYVKTIIYTMYESMSMALFVSPSLRSRVRFQAGVYVKNCSILSRAWVFMCTVVDSNCHNTNVWSLPLGLEQHMF